MINQINKERRRSVNATPKRPSKENQWQRAQAAPKQKETGHKAELKTHLITK
jgi:hypothetical protein